MTTQAAAAIYEAEHVSRHQGMGWAVFNPSGRDVTELPVIYGFNNGGAPGFMHAQLIAQDGTALGSHCCSSEAYMPADLGVLEGSRSDRHEDFRKHYPDGYRMEFVGRSELPTHAGIAEAYRLNQVAAEQAAA